MGLADTDVREDLIDFVRNVDEHHNVPFALWGNQGSRFKVSQKVAEFWNTPGKAMTFYDPNHGWSIARAEYNRRIEGLLEAYLKSNGLSAERAGEMTLEQAGQFVEKFINKTDDKFITGFNAAVEGGKDAVETWYAKVGESIVNKEIQAESRFIGSKVATGLLEAAGERPSILAKWSYRALSAAKSAQGLLAGANMVLSAKMLEDFVFDQVEEKKFPTRIRPAPSPGLYIVTERDPQSLTGKMMERLVKGTDTLQVGVNFGEAMSVGEGRMYSYEGIYVGLRRKAIESEALRWAEDQPNRIRAEEERLRAQHYQRETDALLDWGRTNPGSMTQPAPDFYQNRYGGR
jgi:hypothetical protein